NVTAPVADPAPGATALTVAVKVTAWAKTAGSAEEARVVTVDAWLTAWLSDDDVLPTKLVSPPYAAVTVWLPAPRVASVNEAWPFVSATAGWATPSMVNVTAPVGVPVFGATGSTVAVKVTDCPKTEGVSEEATPVVVLAFTWVSTTSVVE